MDGHVVCGMSAVHLRLGPLPQAVFLRGFSHCCCAAAIRALCGTPPASASLR